MPSHQVSTRTTAKSVEGEALCTELGLNSSQSELAHPSKGFSEQWLNFYNNVTLHCRNCRRSFWEFFLCSSDRRLHQTSKAARWLQHLVYCALVSKLSPKCRNNVYRHSNARHWDATSSFISLLTGLRDLKSCDIKFQK